MRCHANTPLYRLCRQARDDRSDIRRPLPRLFNDSPEILRRNTGTLGILSCPPLVSQSPVNAREVVIEGKKIHHTRVEPLRHFVRSIHVMILESQVNPMIGTKPCRRFTSSPIARNRHHFDD